MNHAWQLPLAAGDWLSILVFLIFVVGSLFAQWAKKHQGETDEEETPVQPRSAQPQSRPGQQQRPPPATAQSEEIRKFLEALGKPKSAPPPPPILRPVQQAPAQRQPPPRPKLQRPPPMPRRPVLVSQEGESDEQGEGGPRNIITGERTRQDFKPLERVDLSQEMAAVQLEVTQATKPPQPAMPTVAGASRAAYFAQLLGNRTNVRQAVVLAEVIGPPKAFS